MLVHYKLYQILIIQKIKQKNENHILNVEEKSNLKKKKSKIDFDLSSADLTEDEKKEIKKVLRQT